MIYDVIIIGSGPAGLAAGLYASRARLNTLIIEKEKAGGQIVSTDEVANYPGSVENATGPSLVKRMEDQVKEFGAETVLDTITEVNFEEKIKVLKGEKGEYQAKTIIIAIPFLFFYLNLSITYSAILVEWSDTLSRLLNKSKNITPALGLH